MRTGAVDEVVIACPRIAGAGRRVVARGFGRQVEVQVIAELGGTAAAGISKSAIRPRPYIGFAPVGSAGDVASSAPVDWCWQ